MNTELNTHTINDSEEYRVFGRLLYDDCRRNSMSRYERNKETYDEDRRIQSRPEDYYTDRDRERDWQQRDEINKRKSMTKWLSIGLIILLIVVVIFVVKACTTHDDRQNTNSDNQQTEQKEPSNEDKDYVQKQSDDIKQQIQETKDSIQNNKEDTQSKLDQLKQKINDLKSKTSDEQSQK